jgi:Ca-activated chloride channel family protein
MVLAWAGLTLLVVALARPQLVKQRTEERKEGFDLVLAIDVSGSMLAEDYKRAGTRINRLDAVRSVLDAFIANRPNDRIGLVVFAGHAYTLSPLTFDHDWLRRQAARVKVGLLEEGTAIGDGLGVSLTRLEQAKREMAGRRVGAFIVLLTDGVSNRGALEPSKAADIAKSRGIPVYTIGAGGNGYVPYPHYDANGRLRGYSHEFFETDEASLKEIATKTGGEFYPAGDSRTIESAFKAIDRAQKIEFEAKSYLLTEEIFWWLAVPGTLCLAVAALALRGPLPTSARTAKTSAPPAASGAPAPQ